MFTIKNSDHQTHRHLHYAPTSQEAQSQNPALPANLPSGLWILPPRLLPAVHPRKGSACRGLGGNQIYFVRRAFSASNTWLFGKSAKRMKHEVSESHPTHCFTHGTVFSPTWIHDRCIWNKRMWNFWSVEISSQTLVTTCKQKLPHSCLRTDHQGC